MYRIIQARADVFGYSLLYWFPLAPEPTLCCLNEVSAFSLADHDITLISLAPESGHCSFHFIVAIPPGWLGGHVTEAQNTHLPYSLNKDKFPTCSNMPSHVLTLLLGIINISLDALTYNTHALRFSSILEFAQAFWGLGNISRNDFVGFTVMTVSRIVVVSESSDPKISIPCPYISIT